MYSIRYSEIELRRMYSRGKGGLCGGMYGEIYGRRYVVTPLPRANVMTWVDAQENRCIWSSFVT